MATKDGPDARGGEHDTHRGKLTLNPAVAPGGVLPRQPHDDLDGAGGNARSTCPVGVGPPPTDQVPVPAKEGLGLDEEPAWLPTVKEPTERSEESSIWWS